MPLARSINYNTFYAFNNMNMETRNIRYYLLQHFVHVEHIEMHIFEIYPAYLRRER